VGAAVTVYVVDLQSQLIRETTRKTLATENLEKFYAVPTGALRVNGIHAFSTEATQPVRAGRRSRKLGHLLNGFATRAALRCKSSSSQYPFGQRWLSIGSAAKFPALNLLD
jgi:hypothetical protein